ncbi:MAG: DUF3179 domain-containing protein [Chloroflexota bacterium]|nr:DUF3179 domain-containing protein [Chloroflexota bacterium]
MAKLVLRLTNLALALTTTLIVISCTLPISTPAGAENVTTVSIQATAPATSAHAIDTTRLLASEAPPFSTQGWKTDFSRRTVDWQQILSGGPPKDGILAIDQPEFESVQAAAPAVSLREPVIVFQHAGDVRAYPLAILIWHEIVNDEVGGKPVVVTFCPLCNASIVFDRTFNGQVLDFGTTGSLRHSDLIMYDRQTESWWQQVTGEGLVGQFAGEQLTFLDSQVISFADFAQAFPDGKVLKIPALNRDYGRNPYTKYDSGNPFLYDGELDTRLPATERVIGLEIGGLAKAYPFSQLAQLHAVNDELAKTPIVVLHKSGTASALDEAEIEAGRDVGSAAVFNRQLGGRVLTFAVNPDGTFQDRETSSTWDILGRAIAGELIGQQLTRVLAFDHFWFAWYAFFPETTLYGLP